MHIAARGYLLGMALVFLSGEVRAAETGVGALSCEQIFAVAQAAVRYRDQGNSLDQVLGGLSGVEAQNKLTPSDMEVLRKAISMSYMGGATPEEIALDCVEGRKKK